MVWLASLAKQRDNFQKIKEKHNEKHYLIRCEKINKFCALHLCSLDISFLSRYMLICPALKVTRISLKLMQNSDDS